eukprot:gnl/MRDRNA2_/MRDRNA2_187958_c0_seq1.p1 gnl/MRDRNA2_/MRDRNA2_187958_c0~~gnl/MRDRNA2_/MRDRNA2_187958_c0_seq1.p1  ORF type:complete len:155 (+),score=10.16 gnl/MRDRNA2_/MRDRNA2_187958_c0_seq1:121-585(+)
MVLETAIADVHVLGSSAECHHYFQDVPSILHRSTRFLNDNADFLWGVSLATRRTHILDVTGVRTIRSTSFDDLHDFWRSPAHRMPLHKTRHFVAFGGEEKPECTGDKSKCGNHAKGNCKGYHCAFIGGCKQCAWDEDKGICRNNGAKCKKPKVV